MHVIGLIGGVASGKSWIASEFARRGAVVLNADVAGHEVLLLPKVKQAIRERWGDAVFTATGEIDRPAVAKIVFAPTREGRAELTFLEQLTHPLIGQRLQGQIAAAKAEQRAAVVLDAPVLLKAQWNRFCTRIVFIDAPQAVRRERALGRGWTEQEFTDREAAQEPLPIKRNFADTVIENAGNGAVTNAQIDAFWRSLAQ